MTSPTTVSYQIGEDEDECVILRIATGSQTIVIETSGIDTIYLSHDEFLAIAHMVECHTNGEGTLVTKEQMIVH
jgi:hypothetical protein